MCDPLFEVCPETAEEPTATEATAAEVVVEEDEEKAAGSLIDTIYNFSFLAACAFGAYSGFTLDWLKSEIESDTTRYPADVAGTRVFDQTWAINAKEPTAWAHAGYFMLATYSVSTLLWVLNFVLGGNGGTVHRIFYRFSQAFAVVPFANLVYIYRIKQAYLINNWFAYYDALGVDKGGTVQQDEYIWMYDPTQATTTSPHYYDAAEHNKKMWTAAWGQVLIGVLAFYAQPVNDKNWEEGLLLAAEAEE